jgi:hypothetical protein
MRLTDRELRVLTALRAAGKDRPHTPAELIGKRHIEHDASIAGTHQTAASLVRKGLARRYGSPSRYCITDAGMDLLATLDSERSAWAEAQARALARKGS